jgi:hypothetical protein
MANGRCRVHGGATPKGVASPHFRTGARSRYLKHLTGQVGAAFKAALADPDLGCLRGELALQTARVEDLLAQLATQEGPAWSTLVLALDVLQMARSKGEPVDAALATLDGLIRSGAACAQSRRAAWAEVRALMQEKTRTSAAESKRLADLQGVVRVEDALLWARALLTAAREEVTDRDQLRRLQERALALLPDDGSGPARVRVVVENGQVHDGQAQGHAPEAGAAPAPEAAPDPSPGPAGDPPAAAPPPSPPTPPAPGPVCGLKELPPGADPNDYEWVPDDSPAEPR